MTITVMKSIFAGVGGSVVLAVFFSTFLSMDKIIFIMPAVVGFNGLLIGYRTVEVLKSSLINRTLFSLVVGLGGGALVFMIMNIAGHFMANAFALTLMDLMIYLLTSAVTSYLGAKLAARYFNL